MGAGRAGGSDRRGPGRNLGRRRHGPAVQLGEAGVEQQQQPGAARVDHAGLGQHGQHLRRALQRVVPLGAGRVEHLDQAPSGLGCGPGRI